MFYKIINYFWLSITLLFLNVGCSVDLNNINKEPINNTNVLKNNNFHKHEKPIVHEVPFDSGSKINFKEKSSIEQKFNIKLSSLQKQLNDKNIPLHPEKFLPLSNTKKPEFNDKNWEEFLKDFQPNQKALLKKMYNNKQFISYDMLTQGFSAVMEKFDEIVQEDYAVAVLYNKRLHWMTSIASVYFANSRLPKAAWKPEDFDDLGKADELMKKADDINVDHFVIIYDTETAYDGEDLIDMLNKLNKKPAMENKRVTAFIPFVSTHTRELLIRKRYNRISVNLVTTDFRIRPVYDFLMLEEKKKQEILPSKSVIEIAKKSPHSAALSKFFENYQQNEEELHKNIDNLNEEDCEIFDGFFHYSAKKAKFYEGNQYLSLTYTEWKIPNRKSFFLKHLEVLKNKKSEKKIHFIPKIIPPYKNFKL